MVVEKGHQEGERSEPIVYLEATVRGSELLKTIRLIRSLELISISEREVASQFSEL